VGSIINNVMMLGTIGEHAWYVKEKAGKSCEQRQKGGNDAAAQSKGSCTKKGPG
jgi:hypothetical protein